MPDQPQGWTPRWLWYLSDDCKCRLTNPSDEGGWSLVDPVTRVSCPVHGDVPPEERKLMAGGVLPRPGAEYGPCDPVCAHVDCQANRTMAAIVCRICSKKIGYDTPFFRDGQGQLVHADCLYDEMERKAKNE